MIDTTKLENEKYYFIKIDGIDNCWEPGQYIAYDEEFYCCGREKGIEAYLIKETDVYHTINAFKKNLFIGKK